MHARRINTKALVGDLPVFLVGDAAGQVKVTTVGGTVTGFGGAIEAVRLILGEKPDNGMMRVKRELDLHLLIRRLLNQMQPGDYQRLIGMLTPPVMNFLSRPIRILSRPRAKRPASSPTISGKARKSPAKRSARSMGPAV